MFIQNIFGKIFRFDSEIQYLQEELRSEKGLKERASREKEIAVAEKYSMEQVVNVCKCLKRKIVEPKAN